MIHFSLLIRFLQVVLALVIRMLGIGIWGWDIMSRDDFRMAQSISEADCDVALERICFYEGIIDLNLAPLEKSKCM